MGTVMAAEIAQQPEALARTLDSLGPLRADVRALANGCRSVLFIARGSSDNAAVYGRYLLETHSGVRGALAAPSVATHYDARLDLTDVLTVSISQSGETAEIVAAQEWSRRRGARTIAVTNDAESTLAMTADVVLATEAGHERAVPATKTYTCQLAAMAIIATALAPDQEALDRELGRVPGEIARLIEGRRGIDDAVAVLAHADDLLVSGRGLLMGTALETALKLEETCLRPVRGLSYADLRHGPIAVVSGKLAAVLISAADGPMVGGMEELAEDLATRGIKATIGVGGTHRFARSCSVAVEGPQLTEKVAPLAAIVPGQLIAEGLASCLGLDPDAPLGLKKVTQTDRETR